MGAWTTVGRWDFGFAPGALAEIVFAPYFQDAHPDHVATTRIVEDARFDAKLTKIDLPGEPVYPRWLFYYYCTHLRWVADPRFLFDISGFESRTFVRSSRPWAFIDAWKRWSASACEM